MSAPHLGFYNTATTRTHVRFQFSTHAAAGGNVAPNSAFEAADLRIYKAAGGAAFSATQRSSANGITMTSPFDSLTGFHDVVIDLTDNTDAGFYAAGSFYSVVLAPDETVDSQTITGLVLAYFEIGLRTVDVSQFGGTAGTFSGGRPEVNTTHAAGTAWGSGAITAAAIAANAINAAKLDPDVATEINAAVLAVLGALNDAAADGAVTTTDTMVAYLKQIINTLEGAPGIPTWPAAAAPGDAVSIAEAIRSIYTQLGVAGAGLSAVPWNAAWDAEVQSEATDALNAYDPPTRAELTSDISGLDTKLDTIDNFLDTEIAAILEDTGTTLQAELDGIQADTEDIQSRLPAALTAGGNMKADALAISGDTTAADRLEALMDGILIGQVNDAAATTTAFAADGFTEATDDHFNGRLITFLTGALAGQQTAITDYDAAGHAQGDQTLVVTALTEAPAENDFFVIH